MNFFHFIPLVGFVFILLMITGRILYLKSVGVSVLAEPGKNQKSNIFLYPVFVILVLLFIWEICAPLFQIKLFDFLQVFTSYLFNSAFAQIAGMVLVFSSLVLLLITLLHFRKSLRFGLDENNKGELIRTGIFCVSRNPFFLSLNLYFLGTALILPNLFFMGFALLAIVGIHFFILKEENFLYQAYGKEYKKYRGKVRRYL
jgi:protein-S-isoprenylcysteine O-methyltransferase Ste14